MCDSYITRVAISVAVFPKIILCSALFNGKGNYSKLLKMFISVFKCNNEKTQKKEKNKNK